VVESTALEMRLMLSLPLPPATYND